MEPKELFVKVSLQDLVKIGVQKDMIDKLVASYEFGERSIYDLYAKPLLVTARDALQMLIGWNRGGGIKVLLYYLVGNPRYTKESLAHIFDINLSNLSEFDIARKNFIVHDSDVSRYIGAGRGDRSIICSEGASNNTLATQGEYTSITRADSNGLTILGKEATGSRVLNIGSPNAIISLANQSTITLDSGGLRSLVVSMGWKERIVSTYGGNDDVYIFGDKTIYTNIPADINVGKFTGANVEVRGEGCKLILDVPVATVFCEHHTEVSVRGREVVLQPGVRYKYDMDASKYIPE